MYEGEAWTTVDGKCGRKVDEDPTSPVKEEEVPGGAPEGLGTTPSAAKMELSE